ncbi:MAG TPA: SRPBCC family protein [Caulobacteraceae bacterium]|nr:SRPBCC family protein [Caulobacteraceae bacterium]
MTAVCPTDVVEAPAEVVWGLLTNPAGWGAFFDVRLERVDPPGPARVGQRVFAESGPRLLRLKLRFEFTDIDAERHRLGLDVRLPFGVTVREDLTVTPLSDRRCRVSYGCDFGFAPGWRGWMGRRLLGRETQTGPVDSLDRLKAAAERAADGSEAGAVVLARPQRMSE